MKKKITMLNYAVNRMFSEGCAVVYHQGKFGYINLKGEVAISFKYDYAYDFVSGWSEVMLDGTSFVIDTKGVCVKYCK